jgi:hypothetical protein
MSIVFNCALSNYNHTCFNEILISDEQGPPVFWPGSAQPIIHLGLVQPGLGSAQSDFGPSLTNNRGLRGMFHISNLARCLLFNLLIQPDLAQPILELNSDHTQALFNPNNAENL